MNRPTLATRLKWLRAAAPSAQLQAMLMEQCRRDIHFWFEHFCWTFDPRQDNPHQPFAPFPFQHTLIGEMTRCIDGGADLLIEKSRDMGVSWLVLLVFQYYWLFREGSNFHLGSRKQESVDRKGDISTLFEKLRYNLDWLPHWMRPPGYHGNRHDNLLRLINPANGNVITGESSNENFGRGGRYKAVFFDEFPFWDNADAAYASAGQSSPCRIVVGTPYGRNNRFAELRFGGRIQVLTAHWRLHPHKDEAWYRQQTARMSEDEVARELDINYSLSLKHRVFSQFGEIHKAELTPAPGRRIIRSWDFGYHCPACLFIQVDGNDRVRVLHEEVGHQTLLVDFAARVKAAGERLFVDYEFEDVCDPAGAQRSDKNTRTSIEILNSLGIYPFYDRAAIRDGLELIRMKLAARIEDAPALQVDHRCEKLIEAFEGGYRYSGPDSDVPVQEHPYEDVMDCLRYAVMSKCGILGRNTRKPREHRPRNRHTGY